LALIDQLDRQRVAPTMALLNGEDDLSRSLEPVDCPVIRLGAKSLRGRGMPSAMARLASFWRRHRVDVLQTYFLDSTYFGVPFARLCGIRKVVRVRNNLGYWMTGVHRRLGQVMGRLASVTLTNAEDGKRALMETERLPGDRVIVLENGVDLDRFPMTSRKWGDGGVVRVGAVANLRPVKNIDGLVSAATRIRSAFPHVRFEVAGEGEQRSDLERLIREQNLDSVFTLRGSVAEIPAFLASLDIAVLNSRSEGMSNAMLEYMAAGRAIVATDVGANRHLVSDGVEGSIIRPGDDAELAAAITKLIQDPDLANRMGAAARRKAEQHYSRAAMVERFTRFYEGLREPRRQDRSGARAKSASALPPQVSVAGAGR
jgi:glycosyltransferase involved in cell wall biosynthesis